MQAHSRDSDRAIERAGSRIASLSPRRLPLRRVASHAIDDPVSTRLGRTLAAEAAAHPGESGFQLLSNGRPRRVRRTPGAGRQRRALARRIASWRSGPSRERPRGSGRARRVEAAASNATPGIAHRRPKRHREQDEQPMAIMNPMVSTAAIAVVALAALPVRAAELGSSVETLLAYARERNPELAAMRHEAHAAAQRVQPAGALPDPLLRVELMNIIGDAWGRYRNGRIA